MSTPWLRLDATILSDPRVVQATLEQGPRAIAAYIFTLTTAKLANKKGVVEVSPFPMARDCGMTSEEAKAAIYTLVTVGLLQITEKPDVYVVPNWSTKQPDKRDAEARAAAAAEHPGRGPGRPRKEMGGNGSERQKTVYGDGDGDGTGKSPSARTSAASAPRRGGARARSRAANETRQAIIATEEARLQAMSGEPE